MGKGWYYFLFLVWFSHLIISSILLFTSGFLLNRVVITKNSTCITKLNVTCSQTNSLGDCISGNEIDLTLDIPVCMPEKSKIILLIIDAFRHDFALYNKDVEYPLPYENKMPFINELITQDPRNNRLYKFIADPPTTTMQRLQALTTGSLPTFIDAGSNFASTEVNEDNLLNQIMIKRKNVVFLGDDTWMKMYPNHFLRSYPYPSFNVWDLDTVDAGVTRNIFREIKNDDWNLLIGHYLGVDHCGHRYGPNHPEMARKLQEMNDVIKNITENMNENAILFVIGDHGMTGTGDHGGESVDEVTAGLFVHSKFPLIEKDQDSVKQIDLIPTLATLLGISIPYANLGTVIRSCLPLSSNESINWVEMASIVWANVQQMSLYIRHYSSITNTFNSEKIEEFNTEYTTLKKQLENKDIDYEAFVGNSISYMSKLKKMCEDVWIQFDSFSITRGLLLCFIPVFFVYTLVNCLSSDKLSSVFSKSFIIFIYVTTIITTTSTVICYFTNIVSNLFTTSFFISGVVAVSILAFALIQNWEMIAMNWHEMTKRYKLVDIFCRFILLASTCSFFSNSFVVQECYVSLFLLLTLVTITFMDFFNVTKLSKTIGNTLRTGIKFKLFFLMGIFCIFIRLSMYYWHCREEQNCLEPSLQKLSNTNRAELIFAIIAVGLVISLTRMWLRYCGNLAAFNVTVLFAQYAPTVITVCCGGFWVLQYLPIDGKPKLSPSWQGDYLALVAYCLIIVGVVITYLRPITAFVIPNNASSGLHVQTKTVPQIFKKIKNLFSEKVEKNDDIPIVCGLATVYSSAFVINAVYILLLFVMLLGNTAAPSAVLLYFSVAVVLCISSIIRYEKSSNIHQLLQVPFINLLTWVFLPIYFFYGSGHQPTFPNIVWEAAFVGTGGSFTNNYIPATLILINTFGSYVVVGFLLPMLQMAPFSLYAIVTSLSNKKKDDAKDLSRGDIILLEHEDVLLANTFTLSCKYICCFGIRVFATMLAATVHCRHLMVWKIFAPKFIFEAISLFVTIPSVLLGYVLLICINSAVNKLVKGLHKGSR